MTIREISFISRERAEALPGSSGMAIISITDPGSAEAALAPTFRKVLRQAFFDAIPADDYIPMPFPGLFDQGMAQAICAFVDELQADPDPLHCIVHCEYGISRSAAVALFIEAYTGAPLHAREFANNANEWVASLLAEQRPPLLIEIPQPRASQERRNNQRF
ncbi:MAG TPA: hypothetical protein PLW86_16450 [Rhodocyclaceae bacterium]|nr:hypothetical protein [Rhodocyclaceae bacterium]